MQIDPIPEDGATPMTLTHEGPHQLSDGRPARVLCWDLKCYDNHPVAVAISEPEGHENIRRFREDGTQDLTGPRLIDAPKRRSVWANVFADGAGSPSETREEADIHARDGRLALLELIYEGGKPVQAVLHDVGEG